MDRIYVVKQSETLKKVETITFLSTLLGIKMYENENGQIKKPSLSTKIQIVLMCFIHLIDFYIDLQKTWRSFYFDIIHIANLFFLMIYNSSFLLACSLPIFARPNLMIMIIEELDKVEKYTKAQFFGKNLYKAYWAVVLIFVIIDSFATVALSIVVFESIWNVWQYITQCMLDIMRIKCSCLVILIIFYVNSINKQLINYEKYCKITMGVNCNYPSLSWLNFSNFANENNFGCPHISIRKLRKVYIRLLNSVDMICSVYNVIVNTFV